MSHRWMSHISDNHITANLHTQHYRWLNTIAMKCRYILHIITWAEMNYSYVSHTIVSLSKNKKIHTATNKKIILQHNLRIITWAHMNSSYVYICSPHVMEHWWSICMRHTMNYSYVWHILIVECVDSFQQHIHMCHYVFIYFTLWFHKGDTTHPYMRRVSILRDIAHSSTWHDSFICDIYLIHMGAITHPYMRHIWIIRDMTYSSMWHDSFV